MSPSVETSVPAELPESPDMAAAPRPTAPFSLPWLSTWIVILSLSAAVSAALVFAAHGTHGFFLPTLAAALCLLAALFDAWTSRIPNQLTYPAIVLGLLLNALAPLFEIMHAHSAGVWLAAAGPASSLLGFAVCAILGLMGCLLGGVHGGDVKLLAAIGALLGLIPTAGILIVALTAAILYSILNLAFFGRLNRVLSLASLRLLEIIYLRRLELPLAETPGKAAHIPMAVPLAIGLITAQIWQLRSGGLIP